MHFTPVRRLTTASVFLALAALLAGCAAPTAGSGAGTSRSGIEVFGTIDAGVSSHGRSGIR